MPNHPLHSRTPFRWARGDRSAPPIPMHSWLLLILVFTISSAAEAQAPQAQAPTGSAEAEVHSPAEAMTFEQVRVQTRAHPQLRSLSAQANAYRAAAESVDFLVDNPTLAISPGSRIMPREDRGLEVQGTLSQPIRLASVAGSRRRSATAQAESLHMGALELAHQRLERTTDLWLALWARRQTGELLDHQLELAEQFVSQVEAAVGYGALTRADLAQARVFRGELAVERHQLTGESHDLGLELAHHLATGKAIPLAAAGDPPVAELPSLSQVLVQRPSHMQDPQVRLARTLKRAAQAQLENSEAEAAPQASLGLYIGRESPNAFVGLLSASIQIPLFEQNSLGRAQATANIKQAEADAQLAQESALARLVQLTHEVEHQREAEAALLRDLLPPLRDQVAAAELLFERGEESVLELMRARQSVLIAERQLIDVRATRYGAEHRLSLLLQAQQWTDLPVEPSTREPQQP